LLPAIGARQTHTTLPASYASDDVDLRRTVRFNEKTFTSLKLVGAATPSVRQLSRCPELCQNCVKTLSVFAVGVSFRAKSRCPDAPSYCKQKWKEAVEGLELSRELAKQAQLSYAPTVRDTPILEISASAEIHSFALLE